MNTYKYYVFDPFNPTYYEIDKNDFWNGVGRHIEEDIGYELTRNGSGDILLTMKGSNNKYPLFKAISQIYL